MLSLVLDLIGVSSFAVSGAMVAIRRKADLFGVLFLALMTALGGGVIRDLLLGQTPPRMFTSYVYIAVAVASALAVFVAAKTKNDLYRRNEQRLDQVDNFFDAIGLAAFTVSGAGIAVSSHGLGNPVLVVSMGMITGFGGGMLRDVLTNAMPMVLTKHVYAVASLAGALAYYWMLLLHLPALVCDLAAGTLVFIIRVLATRYHWNLPRADL